MASLIQERMAIDRALKASRLQIVLGSIYVLVCVAGGLIVEFTFTSITFALVGVGFVGLGLTKLRRARQGETAFNAEHGEDAGKQQPI